MKLSFGNKLEGKQKTYNKLPPQVESEIAEINDFISGLFIPSNFNLHIPLNWQIRTSNNNGEQNFRGLKQLFKLQGFFKKNFEDRENNNLSSNLLILQNILEIIVKFTEDSKQQESIKIYINSLKQQQEYLNALTINPDEIVIALVKHTVKHCNDCVKEVIEPIILSIEVGKEDRPGYYEKILGILNKYTGQNIEKINYLKAEAYYNIAFLHSKNDKFAEAAQNYLEVLKLNPESEYVYNELGNILSRIGEYPIAIKYFKIAKEVAQVLKCLEIFIKNNPSCDNYLKLSEYFKELGIYGEALLNYNRALGLTREREKQKEIVSQMLCIFEKNIVSREIPFNGQDNEIASVSLNEVFTDLVGIFPDIQN